MRILAVDDEPTLSGRLNRTRYHAAQAGWTAGSSRSQEGGGPAPVLMLAAKGGIDDKLKELDPGADHYLARPFSLDEPLARVRALFRRPRGPTDSALQVKGLRLDTVSGFWGFRGCLTSMARSLDTGPSIEGTARPSAGRSGVFPRRSRKGTAP